MLVEAVRLLVTLSTTAIGFSIGSSWDRLFPASGVDADAALIWTVLLGAGFGYVAGGIAGRAVKRVLDEAPAWFASTTGAQLFAGGFGVVVGVVIGSMIALPLIALLPGLMGWPLAALAVLISAVVSGRIFAARADELEFGGRPLGRRRGGRGEGAGYVIDSSAAIDGRVLELVRAGLIGGTVLAPCFVVDELQGLADSGDDKVRRRGRRGLDVLAAVAAADAVEVVVSDDTVPEFVDVDAKLLALAVDIEAALVTTDHNLARAAALRGVTVVNPHALAESLRPALSSGDRVTIRIDKVGSEPGQGVGFLDDGTMVVVNGAADSIGEMLEVEIANMLRTNVGRMAFAHPAP